MNEDISSEIYFSILITFEESKVIKLLKIVLYFYFVFCNDNSFN
jgi:hypothetical protein